MLGNSALSGGSGVLQYPNAKNLRSLRTISPSDVPHSFVINYLYELPFGRGRRLLNRGGIVNVLVGGWQINGVQRYQSGAPLILFNSNPSFTSNFLSVIGVGGNIRVNYTGQPFFLQNTNSTNQLTRTVLNPAAFANPQDFSSPGPGIDIGSPAYAAYYSNPDVFFGTAPITNSQLRQPNFYSEDLSLLKKTRMTESTSLEFRAEAFNVFNRHYYTGPVADFNDSRNFGIATVNNSISPRIIQLGARIIF